MMTMNPGVWMSFHGGGAALILGTPAGRHCAVGSSFECEPLLRSSNSALAQAWNGTSSGFRSAARFWTYLPLGSQIPDRAGRPSASRGAGVARFGLPSDVRGIARAGTFSHWAPAGRHIKESTIKPRRNTFLELSSIFIQPPVAPLSDLNVLSQVLGTDVGRKNGTHAIGCNARRGCSTNHFVQVGRIGNERLE